MQEDRKCFMGSQNPLAAWNHLKESEPSQEGAEGCVEMCPARLLVQWKKSCGMCARVIFLPYLSQFIVRESQSLFTATV